MRISPALFMSDVAVARIGRRASVPVMERAWYPPGSAFKIFVHNPGLIRVSGGGMDTVRFVEREMTEAASFWSRHPWWGLWKGKKFKMSVLIYHQVQFPRVLILSKVLPQNLKSQNFGIEMLSHLIV